MTPKTKLRFLEHAQNISELNRKLLETMNENVEDLDEASADELVQASQKLIQVQNNIIKAVK